MADPTDEEIIQELNTQFDAYMVQLKRLAVRVSKRVVRALNSLKINGYSLSDLLTIIRNEVKAHEDNPNNPHDESLSKLSDVMTAGDYEALDPRYFPRNGIPISEYKALSLSVAANQLTINPGAALYYGTPIGWGTKTLGLTGSAKRYLKIVFSADKVNRTADFTVENDDSESRLKSLYATITFENNAYVVTQLPCLKLGDARLSLTPVGMGIPITVDSQALPGHLLPGWFQ